MTTERGRNGDRWYERLTHGAPLAVLLAAGFLIAYQLLPIIQVVAIAMLLAVVLRTMVKGLERLGTPRWLSAIILVAALAALGALVRFVIVPSITREIQTLLSGGPSSLSALEESLSSLPFVPDQLQILQQLRDLLSGLAGQLPSLVGTVVTVAATIVAVVFLAVYFAVNPGLYISGILRLVPYDQREGFRDFLNRLGERLRGWIVGVLLIAVFVGITGGLGLWALGMPLPLTFGIIAGLLNIIPYAGSIVGGALPALLALTISPVKALLVVVLFIIINQIEGNFLQPVIMGRQIQVPEAAILVSILALGLLLGPIIGTLLAVPAAVLVGVLLEELTEREPTLGDDEAEKGDGSEEKQPDGEGSAS